MNTNIYPPILKMPNPYICYKVLVENNHTVLVKLILNR